MFDQIVSDLTNDPRFPQEMEKWCQQWCRMVNTGNDKENVCHPFGLLIANACQNNPSALQKMVDVMWSNVSTPFSSEPHSALKTAVGTLLAVGAPLAAHITLMDALKARHKEYWSQSSVSKHKAMNDGVHVQTLSRVMDHMAHAYIIPIESKLSGEQLQQLFERAGPVFVQRFANICGNYVPSDNIFAAFENLSDNLASDVMLRLLKSPTRHKDKKSLLHPVHQQTSLNQIIETACSQSAKNLHALEVDLLRFCVLCQASQHQDYSTQMDNAINHNRHAYTAVNDAAKTWECLLDFYPDEVLSPTNADVLQKFMHYFTAPHDYGVSQELYAQLQNRLLQSQADHASETVIHSVKQRKI